ncbi:Carbon storage regulator [bacterium HR40]|nr:Carbon storage regulator [bacterium HR40]
MLYLTRRPGEAVIVNNEIEVRVIEVRGRAVRLGFRFPASASVLREEVFRRIAAENAAAAAAARGLDVVTSATERTPEPQEDVDGGD